MATTRRIDATGPRSPASSPVLDRRPPCSLEAERCVLGSILLKPEVLDDVALVLHGADFYDDANRKIYEHMQKMVDANQKIDHALLLERLKSAGDLETVGGVAYLAKVLTSVPNAAHAVHYAKIIREKATFRELIDASTEILRRAYDEEGEAAEMLSRAEQDIFQILDQRGGVGNVHTIRDVLHAAMERLDARLQGDHTTGGVDTGFTKLDALMGGLHNSELIILAARPSMGKTALALNIAEKVSTKFGKPTLFVSLEMSREELADRLLCSAARVNGHRLRNGTISQEDRRRLVEKASEISEAPLFIDDTPGRTVSQIAAAARRISRRDGLSLIVIDYLQLIDPDNPSDPRQEQVARIARRLKMMARELNVPVMCLAQLNRQADDGKGSRPRLSHLRESGAIEQDADVVMFVHREQYYHASEDGPPPTEAEEAEIIVAKQRNGPTDTVKLNWLKHYTRFENQAEARYAENPDFSAFNQGVEF